MHHRASLISHFLSGFVIAVRIFPEKSVLLWGLRPRRWGVPSGAEALIAYVREIPISSFPNDFCVLSFLKKQDFSLSRFYWIDYYFLHGKCRVISRTG